MEFVIVMRADTARTVSAMDSIWLTRKNVNQTTPPRRFAMEWEIVSVELVYVIDRWVKNIECFFFFF